MFSPPLVRCVIRKTIYEFMTYQYKTESTFVIENYDKRLMRNDLENWQPVTELKSEYYTSDTFEIVEESIFSLQIIEVVQI